MSDGVGDEENSKIRSKAANRQHFHLSRFVKWKRVPNLLLLLLSLELCIVTNQKKKNDRKLFTFGLKPIFTLIAKNITHVRCSLMASYAFCVCVCVRVHAF